MIKLEKSSNIPKILEDNQKKWAEELLTAINRFGGYSNIPPEKQERLVKHYRKKEIRDALLISSYHKCCFCETKLEEVNGYPEVEHFEPKSKYPQKCFDWSNLMPICRYCNASKGDHDTVNESIVNPYQDEPYKFLFFDNLRLKPIENCEIGQKTIDICNLNRGALIQHRAQLFCELEKTCSEIETDARTRPLDRTLKNQLNNFIFNIELLSNKENKYSAFVNSYLENSDIYQNIKSMLTTNSNLESVKNNS